MHWSWRVTVKCAAGRRDLESLRDCFPQGPIAVCLGNHDFWMLDNSRRERDSLSSIIERCWVPAAKSSGVVLLDGGNLHLQDVAIVGGYGHYDLGFAVPGLAYDGIRVTEEDYLRGSPSGGFRIALARLPVYAARVASPGNRTRTGSNLFENAWRRPETLEPSWCCILLLSKSSLACPLSEPWRQTQIRRFTLFSALISGTVRWESCCGKPETIWLPWCAGTPTVAPAHSIWVAWLGSILVRIMELPKGLSSLAI